LVFLKKKSMKTNLSNRRTLLKQLTFTLGAGLLSTSNTFAKPLEFLNKAQDFTPVIILPGGGEKLSFGGIDATFKVNRSQSAGSLSCVEMTIKPGHLAAPPHLHHNFDEICYLQTGTLQVMIGTEVTEIHAGSWHIRPRGIVHTFWNSSNQPAKVIELYTPGGFEEYLKGLGKLFKDQPNPPVSKIQGLAAKYDMVIHFEMLPAIMDKYHVHL
jgi:mannose-6-phosphate isomerase-like protein (cupin superfamily)